MKKDKKRIGVALLEGLGELVVTLICLGLGLLTLSLFGVDFKSSSLDYDLVILLGVAIFFVIFGVIYFLTQLVKKRIKKKHE